MNILGYLFYFKALAISNEHNHGNLVYLALTSCYSFDTKSYI